MDEIKLDRIFDFFTPWLAWGAVIFGSFSLFSYAILARFPKFVTQALGGEIIAQAGRDFILLAAFSVFSGRLIILILTNVGFKVLRILLLQALLQVFRHFNGRLRRKCFVFINQLRRHLDEGRARVFTYPVRFSIFFALCIFIYRAVEDKTLIPGILFFLLIVWVSADIIDRSFKENLRVKLAPRGRLKKPLTGLHQMALSTVFLSVSYIAGASYIDGLLGSAVKLENVDGFKVLFLGDHYSVLVNSAAVGHLDITSWVLQGNDNLRLIHEN